MEENILHSQQLVVYCHLCRTSQQLKINLQILVAFPTEPDTIPVCILKPITMYESMILREILITNVQTPPKKPKKITPRMQTNHNCNLEISQKTKSREPSYSQVLNQIKIDRQVRSAWSWVKNQRSARQMVRQV